MLRKFLIPLLALFLIGVCVFFYKTLSHSKPNSANALTAIPADAVFILETHQIQELFRRVDPANIMWEDLRVTSTFGKLRSNMHFLDSIVSLNEQVRNLLQQNYPFYVSAHPTDNGCNYLYSFALPDPGFKDKLQEFIASKFRVELIKDEIRAVSTSDRSEVCYYTISNGILLFSPSEALIRKAIDQSKTSRSVLNDKSFYSVFTTSKSSRYDIRVFIHLSRIGAWLNPFLDNRSVSNLNINDSFGGWTAMDASIKPKSLLMNGFTSTLPDTSYLDLFRGQEPQSLEALSVMPSNTASFLYLGFSDFQAYYNRFSKHQSPQILSKLDSINKRYSIDISSTFSSWTENEAATILTEPGPGAMDVEGCTFVLLRSNNIEHTTSLLRELCTTVCKRDSLKNDSLQYGKHVIRQLHINGLLPLLFGSHFSVEKNFYVILNNYLLFANTKDALINYLHSTDLDHTLLKDSHYNEFSSNLGTKCNIFLYSNLARSRSIYERFVSEEYASYIRKYSDLLIRFEAAGVQFSAQGNLFYNTAYLEENPIYKKETATLWETRLDTTFDFKPVLLLNHLNNTLDVFVQDEANKLYLISNTGKILWTKQLSEKIISTVRQVDAFKNKKLQILFNTLSHIYLIDRNGADVGDFPVKLTSPATNGLSLLDYKHNADYRLLIACADKHIHNYSIHGKPVDGWKLPETTDTVIAPIHYCNSGGKDYLITADRSGQIYVFDRRGETSIRTSVRLPHPLNSFNIDAGKDLSHLRLLAADSLGNITRINLEGKSEHLSFETFGIRPLFLYQDINADNVSEFIFLSGNELSVFTENKSLLFSYTFSDTISDPPFYLTDSEGNGRIGVVSKQSDEFFLFNRNGILPEGFPLRGTKPGVTGDLNHDNTLQLITGEGKNIYAYTIP
jgi:hypothetical protein